ncbi:MAG: 4-(cytidine 5'-diphospho)-2-C-methyl-D-erythritol kinase [Phycisphaerae bacterium]
MSGPACRPALPRLECSADGLVVHAPAKINLDLLVGPLRADGYHPLDSIVAQVSLYDTLTLRSREDGEVTFTSTGIECGPDGDNLALRAARRIAKGRDVPGVDILLDKVIPPGGGLGGGSSDAAAVLVGCDRLWELGLGEDELMAMAAELGSDVPLFLGPPTSRMSGRGELVVSADVFPAKVLLILPPAHCATGAVYAAYDADEPGEITARPVDQRYCRPPSRWRDGLANDLASAARGVSGTLAAWWDHLAAVLPVRVQLTGSGSGLFCLCDDEAELAACWDALDREQRSRAVRVEMIAPEVGLGR